MPTGDLLSFILLFLSAILSCLIYFQLLAIHCRALLAASALIELSAETMRTFSMKEDEASGAAFRRIAALARLCPASSEAASLRIVEIYYGLLIATPRISTAFAPRLAKHIHDETRACTHFAAVVLEKRITRARQLVRESCPPR